MILAEKSYIVDASTCSPFWERKFLSLKLTEDVLYKSWLFEKEAWRELRETEGFTCWGAAIEDRHDLTEQVVFSEMADILK
mmetsp:Transcript_27212/g.37532  ORF Transcript_27212/g.37532 Transcript_27212/m.37532 type:complete len:81 (-) Transcript_27212:204-446(-)